MRFQIAQKLHAVTQHIDGVDNLRMRDIIDIVLLADLAPELRHVRGACVDVFNEREMHTWPPELQTYDSWPAEYDRLATEFVIDVPPLVDAVAQVQRLIADIDSST